MTAADLADIDACRAALTEDGDAAADTARANANKGRSNRRRGADTERKIVTYLRTHGYPDARRYLAGDGRQPGDIDWHPCVVLEVKDVASSSWPTWCRQAAKAAGAGQIPAVVRRVRGVTDPGAWPVRFIFPHGWDGFSIVCSAGPVVDGEPWAETSLEAFVGAIARLDGHGLFVGEA